MAATTTNKVSSLSQVHFDEILVLMEHNSTTFTLKPNRNYFDLRGEMAATTTNKVSSLSQAHFDEILVLMEYDSIVVILSPQNEAS